MTHDPGELDALRARIDDVDARLLTLLNERAELSLAVGRFKAADAGPVFRPERERAVLDRLTALSRGPLPAGHIRAIWREIFSSSRNLQRPRRVAFLGPEGTHSHAAASAYFGTLMDYQPCRDFREIFTSVSSGACDLGVAPLENALHGTVGQCFDLFMEHEVFIQAEFISPIRHCLLSCAPDLAAVRTVRSHPQALAQCEHWLRSHLPEATLLPAESTAAAARLCLDDPASASIGNESLSGLLSLRVLAAGIEDEANNQTRFVVIGTTPPGAGAEVCGTTRPQNGSLRSSILFTVPDHPGSLAEILNLLARASINLHKLESRPSRLEHWKYAFFADLDSNLADPEHAPILRELTAACHSLRLLGCYPPGQNTVV